MAVQITIIGLGQVGGSIGLALAEHKDLFLRVGHDREPDAARQALKLGAIDKNSINLPSAVREADIVLLSLPVDQIRDTLEIIAQDLRENAVVLDTAPVKEAVTSWAKELLPPNRHYIGLTPVLNPSYLLSQDSGIAAARADLFHQGMLCIVAPPGTVSEAIKLSADLARLIGANALFVDPVENDSLMAATHILPQLVSAALLNATVDQPGWYEARKIAGRSYAEVTNPAVLLSEPPTLSSAALATRENVLRVVDAMIASLYAIRDDLENEDNQSLVDRLERARQGGQVWWSQRRAANWAEESGPVPEISASSEIFGRLIGIRSRKKKSKS
ncbi:MAG: prephenate dehydrogenase [Anaerolineales bacterium]